MKIVIDIDEKDYQSMKNGHIPFSVFDVLMSGTPLPEHHGRLIDADWVKNILDIYVINEYNGQFIRLNDIDSVPTIIEGSDKK